MGAFDDLIKTPNLKLNKPGYGNVADIEALNENFDIIVFVKIRPRQFCVDEKSDYKIQIA